MSDAFSGLAVALATPFDDSGALDLAGYRALIGHVVDGGVDVLVALGSTGEAATLSDPERDAAIETCLDACAGKPVIVGTGTNDTRHAAAMTRRAQELGADGALVVSPYYNKPMPDGLVRHYEEIANAAPGLPIVVYNVPGRTGSNITPETMMRLWDNPQLVALKESSGNLPQIAEIARTLPPDRRLLSGDDNMAVGSIAVGAAGLVSVAANLVPGPVKQLVDAARAGDLDRAALISGSLLPLFDALFVESNPIPLKAGLEMLGIAGSTLRLPLTPASARARKGLADALSDLGVL